MDKKPEKLVPEVRFKGFTDDWEQHKLDALAKFSKGKGYSKKDVTFQGYPLFLYGRLYTNYSEVVSDVDTYTSNLLEGSAVSNADEVVLPDSGETAEDIARASWINKKGIILGGGLLIIHPDKYLINSGFLSYSLSYGSNHKKLSSYAQGKSIVHIHSNDLKKLYIFYPSRFNEQSKIFNILNYLENLITLQQRKLEQLKQLKKAMLQYLLTTEKKSAPLIRNKNYNNKWDTTTFSKLLNYERPENYIVTNTNYRKNGIPVLTANKSFILGYTNESNVYNKGEAIIFDDFTLENKFVNFPFMIKSSAIKILTSKVNYSLYFIFQLLQHTKFIKEGHARHYISVVQKQTVRIPPSYEEQESISDTFSRIQSLIKLQQNKIDQYTTLKKYLLQKMFI